jgi:hypothetical protein
MRRLFWVSVGAVAGVAGYRRATALVRSLRPAPRAGSVASFAADVREGMALYMERQAARSSTLEGHAPRSLGPGEHSASREAAPDPRWPRTSRWLARRAAPSRIDELKDGR